MSLADLPGYADINARFGECGFGDFPDLKCLSIDTYYEEDRERFEKIVSFVLKGKKGQIDVTFGNVRDFRIASIHLLVGFEVERISSRGWESVHYELFDYGADKVHGLAESCLVEVSSVIT